MSDYLLALGTFLLGLSLGRWVGQTAERGWWRRNLLGQSSQPPGIKRRLGLGIDD